MCHLDTLNLSPRAVVKTGSHVNSARAVVEKQADFAAIDAQAGAFQTHDPFAKSLLVIGETAPFRACRLSVERNLILMPSVPQSNRNSQS